MHAWGEGSPQDISKLSRTLYALLGRSRYKFAPSKQRYVSNGIERIWEPTAGTPVIAELKKGVISTGYERNLVADNKYEVS